MAQELREHRGVLILIFGILGFVVCPLFGIASWVMGNGDLKAMDAGTMDPEGRGLTQAGKICGIVSVILNAVIIGIFLLIMIVGLGAAAAGS